METIELTKQPVTAGVEIAGTDATNTGDVPLSVWIERALSQYFQELSGQKITNLYKIVREQIEEAILRFVMDHETIRGNQSKAAILLGISRTTLRKKLKLYGMLD